MTDQNGDIQRFPGKLLNGGRGHVAIAMWLLSMTAGGVWWLSDLSGQVDANATVIADNKPVTPALSALTQEVKDLKMLVDKLNNRVDQLLFLRHNPPR